MDEAFSPQFQLFASDDDSERVTALGQLPDGRAVGGGYFTEINGALWRNLALLFSRDQDCPGVVSFSAARVIASEIQGSPPITLRRDGEDSQVISVLCRLLSGGSAQVGTDFTFSTQRVEFRPGERSKTVLIPLQDDAQSEPTKSFTLELSAPTGGATLTLPLRAQVFILDDETSRHPGNFEPGFLQRLSSQGLPDTLFTNVVLTQTNLWGANLATVLVQTNDDILMAGSFSHVNQTPRANLARLQAQGGLDATFVPPLLTGTVENPSILALAPLPEGNLLVGENLPPWIRCPVLA